MGSGNWIVDNLNSALEMWNGRLAEIWQLISTSPESFKGGGVWNVIVNINDGLKAVGYALLVLFFVMGVVKTCGSFTEMKKPEVAFKCFIRFVLAQAAVSWGMDLMTGAFRVAQGMVTTIMDSSGLTAMSATTLPDELVSVIEDVGFIDSIPLWAVTLLGSLFIWVLSLVMILTVYSRFFKLYIATAIAPIPLASFAGQPSSSIGVAFLKSYAAICMEGCVIVLACVIFSAFASSPPAIADDTLAAATIVWNYVGELIFNMLVLVGAIKMSDRIIRELMALADSAPQALCADGVFAVLPCFANTVGEILHSGSVIPCLHNKIADKADQRKQPGQHHQPYKGEQDAVCQHGMGAIPTVEHRQHGHGVQKRDGHPCQRGEPGEKRQDAKPGDHQKSDHVSRPPSSGLWHSTMTAQTKQESVQQNSEKTRR